MRPPSEIAQRRAKLCDQAPAENSVTSCAAGGGNRAPDLQARAIRKACVPATHTVKLSVAAGPARNCNALLEPASPRHKWYFKTTQIHRGAPRRPPHTQPVTPAITITTQILMAALAAMRTYHIFGFKKGDSHSARCRFRKCPQLVYATCRRGGTTREQPTEDSNLVSQFVSEFLNM